MQVAFASRSLGNGRFCGDQTGFWIQESFATLCVVDGLGHGPEAERAARQVVDSVGGNLDRSLEDLLAEADSAARETRGAAVGIVCVDMRNGFLTHAGIGNTRGFLMESGSHSMKALRSTNGIVGAGYQPIRPEVIPFKAGDFLLLYTDGLPLFPDAFFLRRRMNSPDDMATGFLGEFALDSDDAAILVARLETCCDR